MIIVCTVRLVFLYRYNWRMYTLPGVFSAGFEQSSCRASHLAYSVFDYFKSISIPDAAIAGLHDKFLTWLS
jgi:hypothetical protein